MKKLNFMIVGAQKSGTSALASFVAEHPDIMMSEPKEVHAFDQPQVRDGDLAIVRQKYEEAFSGELRDQMLLGEATPVYLFFRDIARKLHAYNPRLKLIVLLRDPVERAYSQYSMEYARGDETLPYAVALLLEKWRLSRDRDDYEPRSATRHWSYRARGMYSQQLASIYEHFQPSQILVLRSDALRFQHDRTLDRVFRFLGVKPVDVAPRMVFDQETNVSDVPLVSALLRRSYRAELMKLARMVDFSVTDWL